MATVTAIPEIIQSLGADPVAVLAESGVNAELFNDPEHVISLAVRNRMIKHCAERTGCAHFGLLVGQRNLLQSLGLVGALVRYSPDVGAALRSLALHHGVHVRGVKISLTVDGNIAALDWVTYEPGLDANDHVGDGAMACFCNLLGELCGPDWRPTEVWFAHRRPEDVAPFRQFFRVPLRFDAERFALLFPAEALKQGLRQAGISPEMAELYLEMEEALGRGLGHEFHGDEKRVGKTTFEQFAKEVVLPAVENASNVARAS
jgi:hypothetical protein